MKVTIFPVFAPIYRRRPYCVVDFCHFPRFGKQSDTGKKQEETRKFKNLKFYRVVDFRHFPRFRKQSETGKKRETSKILKRGTKSGHTVILCRRFLSLPEIWEAKRHRQETRGNAKVQKFEVLPCGRFSSLSEISEAKRNRQETRNFENFEERDEKWSHSMAAADK